VPHLLATSLRTPIDRRECRTDPEGLEPLQQFLADLLIGLQAAKGDALCFAMTDPGTLAAVA
jgi:hypothetical protein